MLSLHLSQHDDDGSHHQTTILHDLRHIASHGIFVFFSSALLMTIYIGYVQPTLLTWAPTNGKRRTGAGDRDDRGGFKTRQTRRI